MKYLILFTTLIFAAELEVDGNLKVTDTLIVNNRDVITTIDSLLSLIAQLEQRIAQLECQNTGIIPDGYCDCFFHTLDECGVCNGDNTVCADCAGVPNGDNLEDMCGVCDNDSSNDCVQDCFGEWGGTAVEDVCGECGGDAISEDECELTDIDGNTYETVEIGEQVWISSNLKVRNYNDGTDIATGHNNNDWSALSTGAYSILTHPSDGCDGNCFPEYGLLYNWYAVNDDRGLCMEGWHIPSDEEWSIMIDYLGGSEIAGGKLKETGTEYWLTPNTGATNETGFTARPAGNRSLSGDYEKGRMTTSFWSTTLNDDQYPLKRRIEYPSANIFDEDATHTNGWSVRCIQD